MRDRYKNLIVIAGVVLVATGFAHWFILQPLIEGNRGLRNANEKAKNELLKIDKSWKGRLEPSYFQSLDKQYTAQGGNRYRQVYRVLRRANDEFKDVYDPTNAGISVTEWRNGVTDYAYRAAYTEAKERLAAKRIYLHEKVLGLSEDESVRHENRYRLVAHIHVIEQLATLAAQHRLRPGAPDLVERWKSKNSGVELEYTPSRPPAMINAMPVRSYFAEGKDEQFADEFPVEMTLRGKMTDLCKFLNDLTLKGAFLPLDRIEVKLIGAENYDNMSYANRKVDLVEAKLICSGFLVIEDLDSMKDERIEIGGKKKLPAGA